ncbi:MAG: hypothetical protein ACI95C_001443, partial [Pseudohongiellaceae bacterium]
KLGWLYLGMGQYLLFDKKLKGGVSYHFRIPVFTRVVPSL